MSFVLANKVFSAKPDLPTKGEGLCRPHETGIYVSKAYLND